MTLTTWAKVVVPELLPTPTAQAAKHGSTPDIQRKGGPIKLGSKYNLWDIPHLLPTPTAQDGANNAGPSQWNRNSDPLNVIAVKLSGGTTPLPLNDGNESSDGQHPHPLTTGNSPADSSSG